MDVIIVCHTEFGFVSKKEIIFKKRAVSGVKNGCLNLIKLAEKYKAKVTFAVCPEVVDYFPKNTKQEIGLHIHPGWQEKRHKNFQWQVGDRFLRENCSQFKNSSVLQDYPFREQFQMIKTGKDYLRGKLGREPKVFVAGRWSLNNETIKALIDNGFSHDCSGPAGAKSGHYDWSGLSRICLPYHPSEKDYQKKGKLPLLIVPISRTLFGGTVNPEGVLSFGYPWLRACFSEYYKSNVPLFHICLHSPSMTNTYYISVLDNLLSFISKHKNIDFKFASEIKEYDSAGLKTNLLPYFFAVNRRGLKTFFQKSIKR